MQDRGGTATVALGLGGALRGLAYNATNHRLYATSYGGGNTPSGTLILLGILTRLAALPLIGVMLVAILSTKLPMLLADGFWKMAHESRTDFSMLLGATYLLILGAGPWSLDALLREKSK